jgi:ElaB/YqjD/DUF883 family membrane-anchored ribosome-binding protein
MQDERTTSSTTSGEGEAGVASIGNPGGSIKNALEPTRTRIAHAMTTVQQRSNEAISGMTGYIHEAPMRSMVMAMGIGVIIGLLLGDRGYAPWRNRGWW